VVTETAYVEHPAAPDLRADVLCTWIGRIGDAGVPYIDRVLPDGCADIIWNGSRLFVAGPDTGPVPLPTRPGDTYVGIRFRPGHAPAALGCPATAIVDERPDLADLWGPPARVTAERLSGAATANAATLVLQAAVRERLTDAAPADPLSDALVARLSAAPSAAPGLVTSLAAHLGVTERSLHRRCSAAVGYGPKTLHRIMRFRRALALGSAAAPSLGALAAATGYADQAHLSRECRRLAGQTPSVLFKTVG
jgi:AraC-like DNA-binding protein